MQETFNPDGLAISSEQDQVAAVNGHSDPATQILSRRIGRRHSHNPLAMRSQLLEKGQGWSGVVTGYVVSDLLQIELRTRR